MPQNVLGYLLGIKTFELLLKISLETLVGEFTVLVNLTLLRRTGMVSVLVTFFNRRGHLETKERDGQSLILYQNIEPVSTPVFFPSS